MYMKKGNSFVKFMLLLGNKLHVKCKSGLQICVLCVTAVYIVHIFAFILML